MKLQLHSQSKMATYRTKLIFIIGTLLLGLSVTWSQEGVPGQPASSGLSTREDPTCPTDAVGPTCVGCGNLLTCLPGVTVPIAQMACSTLNSSFNGCVGNACGILTTADPNCPAANVDFTCTSAGQFPDPENCRRYLICNADLVPTLFNCPPNYAYNSKTGLCTRSTCQNVDCSKSKNKYLLYTQDPSVLIFCNSEGKPFVFRCKDSTNYQYSLNTLTCEFKCPREGQFPGSSCRDYYVCYQSGRGYAYMSEKCPSGYSFNATSQVCEASTTCTS